VLTTAFETAFGRTCGTAFETMFETWTGAVWVFDAGVMVSEAF
jgi:hypothetical protein